MIDVKSKWENIYTNKQDNEVSWFQENPEDPESPLIASHMKPKNRIIHKL